MRYYRGDEGERLPGDQLGLGITRPEWHAFLDGLLELNAARALPGIRAIVTQRLAQVRGDAPMPDDADMPYAAYDLIKGQAPIPVKDRDVRLTAFAAALLAAEIDRQARP